MTIFGIDYSAARPDPVCLASKGVQFVGRYVEPANDWKTLTRGEADALIAAGIAIVGMYELTANRALGGFGDGILDADGVLEHLADVGMPDDRPIYFAVDFDASADELAGPVRGYFLGIGSVMPLHRIGAYGGYKTIKYLFDEGLIGWGHQTYAWSEIGGVLQWDPRAHIQQYDNGETMCDAAVDLNRGMVDDIGQWPAPVPPPPEDDSVTLDSEDLTAVANAVWTLKLNTVNGSMNTASVLGQTYGMVKATLDEAPLSDEEIARIAAAVQTPGVTAADIVEALAAELAD